MDAPSPHDSHETASTLLLLDSGAITLTVPSSRVIALEAAMPVAHLPHDSDLIAGAASYGGEALLVIRVGQLSGPFVVVARTSGERVILTGCRPRAIVQPSALPSGPKTEDLDAWLDEALTSLRRDSSSGGKVW